MMRITAPLIDNSLILDHNKELKASKFGKIGWRWCWTFTHTLFTQSPLQLVNSFAFVAGFRSPICCRHMA
jgi:hypothetical protein